MSTARARPQPKPALRPAAHPLDGEGTVAPAAPPREERSSALNVKIRPSIHRKLRHLAVDAGRPIAEIVDDLVGAWVEQESTRN